MDSAKRSVVQEYRTSAEMANFRSALEEASPRLGGLWGASSAFLLAAWKDEKAAGKGCCLVVTATQEEADELVEELGVFSTLPVAAFPAWEALFLEDAVPDDDIYRQRLEVCARLAASAASEAFFVVAPIQALLQPVPAPEMLRASLLTIESGVEQSPHALATRFVEAGFRDVPLVEARGEFSLRGDILDVFPYQGEAPLRLEYFGDTLESLREFRAENQRSIAASEKQRVDILLPPRGAFFRDCFRQQTDLLLTDLIGDGSRVFLKEAEAIAERAEKIFSNLVGEDAGKVLEQFRQRFDAIAAVEISTFPVETADGGINLRILSVESYRAADLDDFCKLLGAKLDAGFKVEVYCENAAEAKRFGEILADYKLQGREGLLTRVGPLRRGFELESQRTVFLTTRELFNRSTVRRLRKKHAPSRAIQSFLELKRGDYVVHLAHGVGRYLGMERFEKDGVEQEFLVLEFRNQVRLFVPVSKTDLVQKFVGTGDRAPALDKLGGTSWAKKKERVESALFDLACDLIEVQAMRQERPGIAFPPESEWQREFEAAFPFEDTPDQIEVTEAIKKDMMSSRPMDRLICGDVGYGKTELAMRAAFKAVDGGKQVGILVPTTVLAQQHYRTFRERMAEFPVTAEVVSRFRTAREQRQILEATAGGSVDILIGTHRLLSDDVQFRDLGLVIIDEEQRFGVAHKEKLKQLRSTVDVLTLSATPIPRTLHMALLGIRDISSLSTAPEGRNSVLTEICPFEEKRVREAVIRELNRDGQIYFVHNRVHDIERLKFDLEKLVPEARIEYAHGQMNEHQLEDRMSRFVEGEVDLLIATTIIESGIDIPNVNTIFINQADHYGLADLHQLRGRVGRYKHQAYCYLLLPRRRPVSAEALKRLHALVEFSELGAGFQIALRDLEIRGAGNILGSAQSGHIALVGYDMYCRILEKAVAKLKQQTHSEPVQVEVDFALQAFVPDDFLSGERRKLQVYRRISQLQSVDALVDLRAELRDRYGPLPQQLEVLLDVQELRVLCARRTVEYVGLDDVHLVLRGGDAMKDILADCTARVVILDSRTAAVSLAPQGTASAQRTSIDDDYAFRTALEWFRTGKFPQERPRKRGRKRQPSEIPASK